MEYRSTTIEIGGCVDKRRLADIEMALYEDDEGVAGSMYVGRGWQWRNATQLVPPDGPEGEPLVVSGDLSDDAGFAALKAVCIALGLVYVERMSDIDGHGMVATDQSGNSFPLSGQGYRVMSTSDLQGLKMMLRDGTGTGWARRDLIAWLDAAMPNIPTVPALEVKETDTP